MKEINIVYAFSGMEYAKLTAISILSILQEAEEEKYVFTLLVGSSFSMEEQSVFHRFKEYDNCSIHFYNVGVMFQDAELHIPHINEATYYRLILPSVLQEDKCIYLDSDTVICRNLVELFDEDIEDYYVGGVLAAGYVTNPDAERYCKKAGLADLKQYINAGVLLMNLKKMREHNLSEEFIKYIYTPLPSQDQDIINKVCYGHIKALPCCYNVMTKYQNWQIEQYEGIYAEEMIKEAWNEPAIIHYADRVKPWNNPNSVFSEHWWRLCRKMKFSEEFFTELGKIYVYESLYQSEFRVNGVIRKHEPVLYQLDKHRIALYGAGIQAREFLRLLQDHDIRPECIIVSKLEENESQIQGIRIIGLDQLEKSNRDLTLIVATNSKFHKEIIKGLKSYEFKEILTLVDILEEWRQ